jgi:hypothetical protein
MHRERGACVDYEGRQETWIDWFALYMKSSVKESSRVSRGLSIEVMWFAMLSLNEIGYRIRARVSVFELKFSSAST